MSTPALPFIGIRCPDRRFDQHVPPMLARRRFFVAMVSPVFTGIPFFKHKGHDGHKGKTYEIKDRFLLCVLCVLRGETLSV